MKHAAVAYIERPKDGKLLCVWNQRYGGWSLPGGLVEEGETQHEAVVRELKEETGCEAVCWEDLWQGPVNVKPTEEKRAGFVHIFRVSAKGTPREVEPGSPITWLTREQFLKWSPFAELYEKVFADVPPGGGFRMTSGTMLIQAHLTPCSENSPYALLNGPFANER